jgi:hypothetical protein
MVYPIGFAKSRFVCSLIIIHQKGVLMGGGVGQSLIQMYWITAGSKPAAILP